MHWRGQGFLCAPPSPDGRHALTTLAIRTDASLTIGGGHVMRCLALAVGLRNAGFDCHFICRAGSIQSAIYAQGFPIHELLSDIKQSEHSELSGHGDWLGVDWRTDAEQTTKVLAELRPDWLLIDHYALDVRWESLLSPYVRHIMVIDDLADRHHSCSLLLDQNLGRSERDYTGLVPDDCLVLTGAQYAMLRPEFAALRAGSLVRRASGGLQKIIISLGAIDKDNVTCRVLQALIRCALPSSCSITVVLGAYAPGLSLVREMAIAMPWPTEVRVEVADMAAVMTDSDLAIGAAGSTAWERCCLGLPALMIVLAENQWPGARALAASQAAWLVGEPNDIAEQLPRLIDKLMQAPAMTAMSEHASRITDGEGTSRVVAMMRTLNGSA